MNYFLNMHGGIVFFIKLGVVVLVMTSLLIGYIKWEKQANLSEKKSKKWTFIFLALLCLIGSLIGTSKFLNLYNQGGLKEFFILDAQGRPQLTAWLTRIYSKRVGADYDQRLETFDLMSGKRLATTQIVDKYYSNEYRLFKPFANKAWGYNRKVGIQLLDLTKPEVIADEEKILQLNPKLGDKISLYRGDNVYDPINRDLYVVGADNKTYRLDMDLQAVAAQKIPEHDIDYDAVWRFTKDWYFDYVKGSLGRQVHKQGVVLAADSAVLLDPEFVPEINPLVKRKDKVWLAHKSAIIGNYDSLISYIDSDGQELNKINLPELFKKQEPKVLATLTRDNDILIFVGIGQTHHASIKGFSFNAIRVDKETGKILDEIKYF
ncbi:MAG: hypothetical protein ABH859_00100 [Pseudomonadota bacterium]